MKVRIQRQTDLAGRVVRELQTAPPRETAEDIAEAIDSTPDMVRRVMMPLVAAGWVRSTRGRNGGYRLAAAASEMSLLELIETFEGPIDDGVCVLVGGPCGTEPRCAMHDAWNEARSALVGRLAQIPVTQREGAGRS